MKKGLRRAFGQIGVVLVALERTFVIILFIGLTLVGSLQIVNRHGLNLPIWNLEQLLPHIFIVLTFFGIGLMYRDRATLAVELLPSLLPLGVRRPFRAIIWLITIAFLALITYAAIGVIQFQIEISAVTNMSYPAIVISIWLPVGLAIGIVRIVRLELIPLLRGDRQC